MFKHEKECQRGEYIGAYPMSLQGSKIGRHVKTYYNTCILGHGKNTMLYIARTKC